MKHAVLLLFMALGGLAPAQEVEIKLPVQEAVLDNGMKILVVERHDVPRAFCALYWKVGSVNERPGITGVSHFFEHMMFKGTKTIGTTDIAKDTELNAKVESIMARVRALKVKRLEMERLGRTLTAVDEASMASLMKDYDATILEQRKISVGEHLSKLYQAAGGTGLNATTSMDRTNYFVDLPSNKVELFFWLEADRFNGPIFREFYPEREVVKEERRMRTDSTPTGLIDVDFRAMFWQAHPYSWPVIGWMSDIDQYTMADAQRYFDVHYSPQNCTAIFVGDVKTAEIHAMAQRYFGRLKRSPVEPDPIVTLEPRQMGERRMIAEADTNPYFEIAWHGPSQAHKDGTGLDVTMGVLTGRTGRLWRTLVDDRKLALSANASFWGLKYGGMPQIHVNPRPTADFAATEAATYEVVEKFAEEGPTENELRKVKNGMLADLVRSLQTNEGVAHALGMHEMLGSWRDLQENAKQIEAVTAEDVKRLVRTYMTPGGRNVLVVKRKEKK